MSVDSPKSLVVAGAVLLLAIILVYVAEPFLDGQRLTNLDVDSSEVGSLYVQMDPRLPGRCYVTDRQGSTVRRSDDPSARQPWEYLRGDGESSSGNLGHWVLRSKRRGTILLVPVFAVSDWAYPYFHQFARSNWDDGLSVVRWTRLFVNRVYHGLYLEVHLPSSGKDDLGGASLRPELLLVSGNRAACADSRLVAPCQVYPGLIAMGRFPRASRPTDAQRLLLALSEVEETLLMMQPEEPYTVSWVPVPVSLSDEYRRIMGTELPTFEDERFRKWSDLLGPSTPSLRELISPARRDELWAGWAAYRDGFSKAARVHCEYHQCMDELAASLESRLDSTLELPVLAGVLGEE